MENEKLNRRIHEAMGEKWNDWPPNPDYCNSLPDAFEIVEWMRQERDLDFNLCARSSAWRVFVYRREFSIYLCRRDHESLPMAISLAAIEVLTNKE